MFEQWLEAEKADIKAAYGKARAICLGIMVLMALNLPMSLIMLLDGGGVMEGAAILITVGLMALVWRMGDYKGRFVKPLLTSVEEVLPTQGERDRFTQQMEGAMALTYSPAPQLKPCRLLVGEEYLYLRQPGKSRVVKNRSVRRATLAKDSYTQGRGHVRTCYDLALYTDEEKPVWQASFRTEGEAYQMLEVLKPRLPENLAVEDGIAYGKTEEGKKKERKELLQAMLMALVMVAVLVILAKLIQR